MTTQKTIKDAIKSAMQIAGHPVTAREAYDTIIKNDLYHFGAKSPVSIVQAQLRKHCVGNSSKNASDTKHFEQAADGKFWFLDQPKKTKPS